jgi:hypothetical protein
MRNEIEEKLNGREIKWKRNEIKNGKKRVKRKRRTILFFPVPF